MCVPPGSERERESRVRPRVQAVIHEQHFRRGLLGHVLGDDFVAQVYGELPNLALCALRLSLEHLLLESDVKVEKNEEEGNFEAGWCVMRED